MSPAPVTVVIHQHQLPWWFTSTSYHGDSESPQFTWKVTHLFSQVRPTFIHDSSCSYWTGFGSGSWSRSSTCQRIRTKSIHLYVSADSPVGTVEEIFWLSSVQVLEDLILTAWLIHWDPPEPKQNQTDRWWCHWSILYWSVKILQTSWEPDPALVLDQGLV